jgi:hypothetical protein
MKISKISMVLAASLLASACSTTPRPSFETQAAPDANLAKYSSYSWAFPVSAGSGGNPFLNQRIRDALDRSLANAGYSQATEGEGDMIVAFTVGARDRVDVTDWGPVAPYYPGYGRAYRYGWAYSYREVDVRTVTEGSLALDVFDAASDRPVWHGIASSRISSQGASDELIQAAADGLVARLSQR